MRSALLLLGVAEEEGVEAENPSSSLHATTSPTTALSQEELL